MTSIARPARPSARALGAWSVLLALALVALVTLAFEASWGRDGGEALLGAGPQRVVRAVQWAAAGPMLVVAVLATLAVLAYVAMGLVVLATAAGPFLLVLALLTRWAPGPPGAGRPGAGRPGGSR